MAVGSIKNFIETEIFSISGAWSCFLVDNGSLRPEPTLLLRKVACELGGLLGVPVHPVSLLHSSKVDANLLEGMSAQLLEPMLRQFLKFPDDQNVLVIPQFFGPSRALTEYLPKRLDPLRKERRDVEIREANCLLNLKDNSTEVMAEILMERVQEVLEKSFNECLLPQVILVDHGSAQQGVNEVRKAVAVHLKEMLAGRVHNLAECSMERPDGVEISNNPLLSEVLSNLSPEHPVVLAMMFFGEGKHASRGGDVERICQESGVKNWDRTDIIGNHPLLIQLLAKRALDAVGLGGLPASPEIS